jgi:hypothetical protein
MIKLNLSRAVLAMMLVAITAPAYAVMAEPVFWGGYTVENAKKQPIVDGFVLGSGVWLTNYAGLDASVESFWKPNDKNWDKNLRIGDVVDLSATGVWGQPTNLYPHDPQGLTWVEWSLRVEPFVAHAGLNVTHFTTFGTLVGPGGYHYNEGDVGYYYGYFSWGAATINFEQEKNKKLSWAQLDYTLVETYREQGHYLPQSDYPYFGETPPVETPSVSTIVNPEPSTIVLMLGGLGLLLLRKFGSHFSTPAVASVSKT